MGSAGWWLLGVFGIHFFAGRVGDWLASALSLLRVWRLFGRAWIFDVVRRGSFARCPPAATLHDLCCCVLWVVPVDFGPWKSATERAPRLRNRETASPVGLGWTRPRRKINGISAFAAAYLSGVAFSVIRHILPNICAFVVPKIAYFLVVAMDGLIPRWVKSMLSVLHGPARTVTAIIVIWPWLWSSLWSLQFMRLPWTVTALLDLCGACCHKSLKTWRNNPILWLFQSLKSTWSFEMWFQFYLRGPDICGGGIYG